MTSHPHPVSATYKGQSNVDRWGGYSKWDPVTLNAHFGFHGYSRAHSLCNSTGVSSSSDQVVALVDVTLNVEWGDSKNPVR